jgi:DNA-binding GntR family transcriptional regulator
MKLNVDKVVEEIQYGIMAGEFRPKQRLVETDLMQRFSVGRGVIRDSLKILADRRLVSRNQHKGATVIELSAKEIRDLYLLRSYLEGIAGELAFDRITPRDIQEMSRLQEKLEAYTRVDRKLVKLHEALHEIIFKASGNDFLFWQIKSLIILAGPVRYFTYAHPDQRQRSLQEHDQMIQFLRQRTKDKFIKLCRNHIIPPMKAYVTIFYPQEARDIITELT